MSTGFAVKHDVVTKPSSPVAAYSAALSGRMPPAATRETWGVDPVQLLHERRQLGDRDLVNLDAIDAGLHQSARVFGICLNEQLLLDATATDLRQ